MSTHTATIQWHRQGVPFLDNRYTREHRWTFDGGAEVLASAAPSVVPAPMSNAAGVDPEEAFVASLSSCHMLWFLAIAAKYKYVVDSYEDNASGTLAKNSSGKWSMTHVRLNPLVRFSGSEIPTREKLEELHHKAHEACYIANSVTTEVTIEIR